MNGAGGRRRVLFAGGGTAGHLMPAINVALEMKEIDCNIKMLFVGRKDGMEAPILAKFGFSVAEIEVLPLKRNPAGFIRFVFNWRHGYHQAMLILREFDPAVVVGSGGYVSAPVIRAAYKLGMPIYFQEQNSLPGLATRTLGKMADTIFTAYESAARYLPAEKCRLVGNPLRPDLLDIRRDCGAKEFSLDSQKKTLLILGGSSGARSINDLVSGIFKAGSLPADWQILWQTGQKDFGEVSAALSGIKFSGRILPFIDNMSAAYACADLVLSRAGAMALAEMAARGLPSILIPYPHATGNHQTLNARAFGDTSAAILLAEPVPQENFESVLKNILADEGRRAQMSSNAKKLARPEAAKIIARTVLDRINEI